MDILHEMIMPWRGDDPNPEVHNHFVSDAITQYIPYRMFAERSYREDGFLGWNPYVLGGTPFYANTMATPYDWTMELHRWLPFWVAWHWGIAAQFFMAGLGVIIFLRSQGMLPAIALTGAVAFAGGTPLVFWLYHRWALGSFCWMPWLLWALMQWRTGRRWGWVLFPVFLALSYVGGTIQHAFYVTMGVSCVWLAWLIEDWGQIKTQVRMTGQLALGGLLGAGLAAYSLCPALAGFFETVQGGHQQRGGLGYPGGSIQPILNAISYLAYAFPWPLGNPQSLDLWKVLKSDLFNICFFGFLPTLLALILVWNRRLPLAPRLLVALGLLVPLTPLVGPLYHRINLLCLTGGIWLMATGLQNLTPEACRRLARGIGAVFLLASIAWLAASVGLVLFRGRLDPILQSVMERKADSGQAGALTEWLHTRCTRWMDEFPIWSDASLWPWLLAVAGLACLYFWNFRTRPWLQWVLAAIVLAEVTFSAERWITFNNPSRFPAYPETSMIARLKAEAREGRVSLPKGTISSRPFPPNTLMPYGIITLQGYDSIHPRFSIGEQTSETLNGNNSADRGVSVAVFSGNAPAGYEDWRLIETKGGTQVLVAPVPHSRYMAETPQGLMPCLVEKETPNQRILRLPAGATKIQFLENWDPGWSASLGGNPLPLGQRKEGTMEAILPINTDQVVLSYKPLWYHRGLILSALAALGLVGIGLGSTLRSSPARGDN